jgi:hypothetical protein
MLKKILFLAIVAGTVSLLSGCGHRGYFGGPHHGYFSTHDQAHSYDGGCHHPGYRGG